MAVSPDAPEILTGTATTAEYVASHAVERPDAAALIQDGRVISYAQFSRDVGRFATALSDLELRPGSTAAVGCADLYTQWRLLLAFEQLNVATAPFGEREDPAVSAELLARADVVLADSEVRYVAAERQLVITPEWVLNALSRESLADGGRERRSAGDIVRIVRSSGTTGRPKRIAYTRRMHELRVVRDTERYQFTRDSRYLLTLGFSVGPHYGYATACLRAGGCVVDLRAIDTGAFAKYRITHVGLTPHLLKSILDDLPANFVKPAKLIISCAGSALSDQLAERALRLLATEVIDSFGTNEIGGISFRRAGLRDNFATVCPGVEVEVVDDSGRALPSGRPGRLRVRSESLAAGYLDDPEATRRFFQDGWFYTNDVAVLDGPRRLKLLGRGDEMITTIGGKYAPSDLEAAVMAHLGEGDVGVCAFANRDGVETVHVAIAGTRLSHQELLELVGRAFGAILIGNFVVLAMASIPRNAAGKIERARLKEAVAELLKRS